MITSHRNVLCNQLEPASTTTNDLYHLKYNSCISLVSIAHLSVTQRVRHTSPLPLAHQTATPAEHHPTTLCQPMQFQASIAAYHLHPSYPPPSSIPSQTGRVLTLLINPPAFLPIHPPPPVTSHADSPPATQTHPHSQPSNFVPNEQTIQTNKPALHFSPTRQQHTIPPTEDATRDSLSPDELAPRHSTPAASQPADSRIAALSWNVRSAYEGFECIAGPSACFGTVLSQGSVSGLTAGHCFAVDVHMAVGSGVDLFGWSPPTRRGCIPWPTGDGTHSHRSRRSGARMLSTSPLRPFALQRRRSIRRVL